MKFRFAHNNFNVKEMERSLQFYQKALGLKETRKGWFIYHRIFVGWRQPASA